MGEKKQTVSTPELDELKIQTQHLKVMRLYLAFIAFPFILSAVVLVGVVAINLLGALPLAAYLIMFVMLLLAGVAVWLVVGLRPNPGSELGIQESSQRATFPTTR